MLWIRSSDCCEQGHWPLPQFHTPPFCLSLPPPHLMIHNGFLCFNVPDAHWTVLLYVVHTCMYRNAVCETNLLHCSTFLHLACHLALCISWNYNTSCYLIHFCNSALYSLYQCVHIAPTDERLSGASWANMVGFSFFPQTILNTIPEIQAKWTEK